MAPLAFEFSYGFDGARRWSRDVAANVQSWLPCGVQCSAGELAELSSTNGGASWSVASTNLTVPTCDGGLVRAGSQFVLRDLQGRVARATDSAGAVVATATFDAFGVQRFGTGTLASGVIRDTYGSANEDGLQAFLAGRGIEIWQELNDNAFQRAPKRLTSCLVRPEEEQTACHSACRIIRGEFPYEPDLQA